MACELYTEAVLSADIPRSGLLRGDLVKIVERHAAPPGGEEGCTIEAFNASGETIAVTTVKASQLAPVPADAVLCARAL